MDRHLFLALFIPALFLGFTGLVKSLVRKGFAWANFYLGLDIALAALANGVVNVVDIGNDIIEKTSTDRAVLASKIMTNAEFIIGAFALLLVTMMIHQHWDELAKSDEDRQGQRIKRGRWLGLIATRAGRSH